MKPYLLLMPVFLFVALVLGFVIFQPLQVLPRITLAPGFSFTDYSGQRLTNEDLRGKIVLYTFTYTTCKDDCAESGAIMQAVQAELAQRELSVPVELVTISFDPENDTAQQLAAYAAHYEADPMRWHIVSGEATPLKQVIGGGFTTYYTANNNDGFDFDPAFILVDGWGIMRAEYRTATPSIDSILRDIELVVSEALNSEGAARYAYEAAHLFLCYPR
jgi:protein SCO1/2